ncbi:MAG TPA: class I SAM-dependent methyltransferase [Thermomicrobiales bacterium]|nr:class I SAM-dependent methyltransferase [Thermomicrobiales bacterium]
MAATGTTETVADESADEARLVALIDRWTTHMRWRADFARWRERRLWQERYQEGRLRQLRDLCGPLEGRPALDVGCGMGGLVVALRRAGARAVGHEPNRAYGEICRLRAARYGLDLPFVAAVGEALPFRAGAFDIVTCLDVLEHADDLDATLAEIARVLRPGGHAVVTATNRFAFRDPHYHLRGVNWLPRPWAEALIRRRGRGKDAAAFADRQALSAMHYVTYRDFAARCRALGFAVEDTRERRVRAGGLGSARFRAPIRLLRRLHLAVPAYRLYRALFLGTFEVHLTEATSDERRATSRDGGVSA